MIALLRRSASFCRDSVGSGRCWRDTLHAYGAAVWKDTAKSAVSPAKNQIKGHGNATIGLVIARQILSRRAWRRLSAAAALPHPTVGQAAASGCPWTMDQARHRSHVTRLICHQLVWQRRGWFVWSHRVFRRHLSSTSHQHCPCVGTLTATRHQGGRALFHGTEMQPAREHVPMLAHHDHTHTGRARDQGRIKHALTIVKELLGCRKQPRDRRTLAAEVALW